MPLPFPRRRRKLDSERRVLGASARVWLALIALLATAGGASAQSNETKFALHWVRDEGAESCVSEQTLRESLSQLGAGAAPQTSSSTLDIEGLVRRDALGSRWVARIRLLDAAGQTDGVREVESSEPDCAALTAGVLLVLAWMTDSQEPPEQTPPEQAPAGASAVDTEKPPPVVLSERVPEAQTRAAMRRWSAALGAGLAGGLGMGPGPSFGPSLGAHLDGPRRIGLALTANYWIADRVPLEQPVQPGAAVSFRALQANLALCAALLRPGPWSVSGCWGGLLGARFTRSEHLAEPRNPARIYGGPSSSLQLARALRGRWSLALDCTGVAFGRDDRFTYVDGTGETRVLFHPPRFGGWVALGAMVRL